ncbi:unnamed protein product [Gongylonema pulchrum]|uniref:Transmembrane protein n=1 Tax=Gongylonema pulchrum TaxID=637853 RepID=A0A183EAW4_9BILA|nr:unnamed protein product [Gongylonema pulchrum]
MSATSLAPAVYDVQQLVDFYRLAYKAGLLFCRLCVCVTFLGFFFGCPSAAAHVRESRARRDVFVKPTATWGAAIRHT